jgi:hypothetical protein
MRRASHSSAHSSAGNPRCSSCALQASAASSCGADIGRTRACSGASQPGSCAPCCSSRMPKTCQARVQRATQHHWILARTPGRDVRVLRRMILSGTRIRRARRSFTKGSDVSCQPLARTSLHAQRVRSPAHGSRMLEQDDSVRVSSWPWGRPSSCPFATGIFEASPSCFLSGLALRLQSQSA